MLSLARYICNDRTDKGDYFGRKVSLDHTKFNIHRILDYRATNLFYESGSSSSVYEIMVTMIHELATCGLFSMCFLHWQIYQRVPIYEKGLRCKKFTVDASFTIDSSHFLRVCLFIAVEVVNMNIFSCKMFNFCLVTNLRYKKVRVCYYHGF